jgi:hypothetical protein
MQRVAKAGYIEVPDAFMERVNPYEDHRAEITVREGRLIVRKKSDWKVDPELVELYEARTKPLFTGRFIPLHPFLFHIRHYWEGQISFQVTNPEVDASWSAPVIERARPGALGHPHWRDAARRAVRALMSQWSRNRTIDLCSLLACPSCAHPLLIRQDAEFACDSCAARYPDHGGLPMLYPASR